MYKYKKAKIFILFIVLLSFMINLGCISVNKAFRSEELIFTYDETQNILVILTDDMSNLDTNEYPWAQYATTTQTLIFDSDLTVIEANAFVGFNNLEKIEFSDSITTIKNEAFSDCSSLENITLPSNIQVIQTNVFSYCYALTTITIPNSIVTISSNAFRRCISLEQVYYEGTLEQWNEISIDESNIYLTNATINYLDDVYCSHTYTATTTPPTCTESGYTTYKCEQCGDTYTDNETDPTGHTFGEWITTTAATCSATGIETRYCTACEAYETQEISKTDHTYTATITAPTCTENGYTTYKCEECGDTYTAEETNPTGHTFGEWITTTTATCSSTGTQTRYCTACEAYETQTIDKVAHTYTATTTPPTCTESGYTTYKCEECGDTYTGNETDPTGHTFGEWITTTAATCSSTGTQTRYCADCEAYETQEIAKTSHIYTATITAPTCTENGYTTYKCEQCGDTYTDNETDPTGHTFGNWITTTPATCTSTGIETRTCEICGATETQETVKTD
ncbi:MAG: leucine-rich repeat domain-containing protein, partial [Clostridia bacterium]